METDSYKDWAQDDELLKEIKRGNHKAFSVLVKRHASKFYAIAFRILGNKTDAEDIVQDLFLKLWKNPEIWQEGRGAKFSTWFYRIITNRCIDFQRKKKPEELLDNFDIADKADLEASLDEVKRRNLLEKLILELPERQRLAINLCFFKGMSNKEAAEIMGINIKALESLLMRAKKTLKSKVNKSNLKEMAV